MAKRRASRSPASDPAAPEAAALAEASRYLARRARATAEVARHLAGRGYDLTVVAATLGTLRDRRYVDDEAFALRRAEEALLRRGHGPLRVRAELTRSGLADSVVERALTAVLEHHRLIDLARRTLRRRWPDRSPIAEAEYARAHRFLVGRGFPDDVVRAALEEDD